MISPSTFRVLIFLLVISGSYACEGPAKPAASDAMERFNIGINGQFELSLKSNAGTGYAWKWANQPAVTIVDSVSWRYSSAHPGLPGSNGLEIWTFRGIKPGMETLTFEYCRSWDPNSTIETRSFVVKVK